MTENIELNLTESELNLLYDYFNGIYIPEVDHLLYSLNDLINHATEQYIEDYFTKWGVSPDELGKKLTPYTMQQYRHLKFMIDQFWKSQPERINLN